MDSGKVGAGEKREEREDEEAEMRIRGLESFVEPLAKRVRAGARGRRGKGGGNEGVSGGRGEERKSGAIVIS